METRNLGDSNPFDKEIGKVLAFILQSKPHLIELDFSKILLSARSIKFIADAMINHPSLRMLNLTSNPIGSLGASHISDGVWGCSSIKFLLLRSCNIGDSASEALAAIIRKHPSLTYIDLRDNRITDYGVKEITKALNDGLFNPGLIIRLEGNQINLSGEDELSFILNKQRLPAGLRVSLQHPLLISPKLQAAYATYIASIRIKRAMFFQACHQDQSPFSLLPYELLNNILYKSDLVKADEIQPLKNIQNHIEKLTPRYFAMWKQPLEVDEEKTQELVIY